MVDSLENQIVLGECPRLEEEWNHGFDSTVEPSSFFILVNPMIVSF